jgi:hypothetical protein
MNTHLKGEIDKLSLPTGTLPEQRCQSKNELSNLDEPGHKTQLPIQTHVSGHIRLGDRNYLSLQKKNKT